MSLEDAVFFKRTKYNRVLKPWSSKTAREDVERATKYLKEKNIVHRAIYNNTLQPFIIAHMSKDELVEFVANENAFSVRSAREGEIFTLRVLLEPVTIKEVDT